MTPLEYDIAISGAGLAGMIAALAFASRGKTVALIDPRAPMPDGPKGDLRSTAFLQPSQALLEEIGLWDHMNAHATALDVMRIADAGGETGAIRLLKDFRAEELSDLPFAWNLPNIVLHQIFWSQIVTNPAIETFLEDEITTHFARLDGVKLGLKSGKTLRAKLAVAADGRNSALREMVDIPVKTTRFGQKALAFCVTHPIPHENVSTEIHRTGGPFTLVPLPDRDGKPASAIVWMEEGAKADELAQLNVTAFETVMNERSCGILGPLTLVTERSIWPIIAQHATQLWTRRTALIAEAAHVVPPIGAQGLNMSISDIRALLETNSGATIGTDDALADYEKLRLNDIKTRVTGITALNKTSMASAQVARELRAQGIEALYTLKPVRQGLMRMGLGAI
jgi:2-octaprenyl-6-methoxyphenol hydroxylase